MWLQRIELVGFKSFANKTALEFLPPTHESRGITAIVGPNGSGKSCIVDAIRWVLGEQSMKLLRGKKSEDVIFAGTPRRPRLGVAEVTLHLNNEDQQAPIDYTEVEIGRRVYRSGESEYLLNGAQVRREDVLLLLAKARVGQRTYSIIGQGMVDQFLLASPTERKAFFDEAAGIRPAELKRDHAIARLERASENLRQGETLLAEITPRLRSLSRQVKRLERREDVERELRTLLEHSYGHRWRELRGSVMRVTADWQRSDAERQRLQHAVDTIQSELGRLERAEQTTDTFLPLQREYEALVERRQELRERILVLRHAATAATSAATPLPATAIAEDIEAILRTFDDLLEDLRLVDRLEMVGPFAERLTGIQRRLSDVRKRCAPVTPGQPPPETREAEGALKAIEASTLSCQKRMSSLHEEERRKKGAFFELQRNYRGQQLALNECAARANDLRILLARLEQRREDLRTEIQRDLGESTDPDVLAVPAEPPPADAAERIVRLQRELAAIGTLDDQTMQEYRNTSERAAFLEQQTTDLRQSITALERVIEELELEIDRAFHVAFATINEHFERYFRQLFGGGQAKLALIREEPPEDDVEGVKDVKEIPDIPPTDRLTPYASRLTPVAGIDIAATPPGKRIKSIAMLSGGERALVAIALLCAIISSSRSPFVVLDEVDAALDEANSVRFAEILRDLSKHTQFLVVTHNRYSMERAVMIYGVTMGDDGASKLLSLKLEEANAVAA